MQRRQLLLGLGATVWPTGVAAKADAYALSELKDFDDAATSLKAQAGGLSLVVVVMKGHWCRVCIKQLQRLGRIRSRLKSLNGTVVGLNADSVAANRSMAKSMGLVFPVLSDPRHIVIEELGLWLAEAQQPMPAIVVFDRCGTEVGRRVGRRPGDAVEGSLLALLQKIRNEARSCPGRNA